MITVQALQPDGTWAVRNAFITENKQVISGGMQAHDLMFMARRIAQQWSAYPDGKQMRVQTERRRA